jgi:glycine/D-amino acid oxidase-like deaminating enzyme/nitrite reductase/ring-hydroxylating ferredoxin subunit
MPVQLDTTPLWSDVHPPLFSKLGGDLRVEVLVIGGGITGLTAAYLLALEGKSVAVVERGRCARVDTGHTSAHVTMVTDLSLGELASTFGRDHAQAVWDAGLAAMSHIDSAIRREAIDCDFAWVPGYLHAPGGEPDGHRKMFEDEASLAADLGFDARFVDFVPVVGGPGVCYENQARFHPGKYLAGLARAIVARGGRIFEHSAAGTFVENPRTVAVNGRHVRCDEVVIATHNPLTGTTSVAESTLFQTKLALYTSCVVAGRVPKGTVPDILLWGTDDPYHYFRIEPHAHQDVVIYGGEDRKTGQADDGRERFERLEKGLAALVPGAEVTHRWSGQVIETPDGLPYIGDTAPHQFAATGFSGNGMTFGTLAGVMAVDRILGLKNPWSGLFSPSRSIVRGGVWDYIRENKDYPYYKVRDWFAGAEGKSLRGVPRGAGKIVEHNGEQVAAYRDEDGELTLCSAICTHMGCLVDWNSAERTWDCPCHGSRFKTTGAVIAGPAESPLERVKR